MPLDRGPRRRRVCSTAGAGRVHSQKWTVISLDVQLAGRTVFGVRSRRIPYYLPASLIPASLRANGVNIPLFLPASFPRIAHTPPTPDFDATLAFSPYRTPVPVSAVRIPPPPPSSIRPLHRIRAARRDAVHAAAVGCSTGRTRWILHGLFISLNDPTSLIFDSDLRITCCCATMIYYSAFLVIVFVVFFFFLYL
jgi:hypothetical protein